MNQTVIAYVAARPSPSATRRAAAGATHGAPFFVLAVLLVGALLISAWRLRRRTSNPET